MPPSTPAGAPPDALGAVGYGRDGIMPVTEHVASPRTPPTWPVAGGDVYLDVNRIVAKAAPLDLGDGLACVKA